MREHAGAAKERGVGSPCQKKKNKKNLEKVLSL